MFGFSPIKRFFFIVYLSLEQASTPYTSSCFVFVVLFLRCSFVSSISSCWLLLR